MIKEGVMFINPVFMILAIFCFVFSVCLLFTSMAPLVLVTLPCSVWYFIASAE